MRKILLFFLIPLVHAGEKDQETLDIILNNKTFNDQNIVPGMSVNLMARYGYLSLTMRFVGKNDSGHFMFLEPAKKIFKDRTVKIVETFYRPKSSWKGNFLHVDLCDDSDQLVDSYLRRFKVEGSKKSWVAFAGGWRPIVRGKFFGIQPEFANGDYSYMLVRANLVLKTGNFQVFPNVSLDDAFVKNFKEFRENNSRANYLFYKDVGTHYAHSYIVGNAVYQVFVFDRQGFNRIKSWIGELNGSRRAEYISHLAYLLPIVAKHIGIVMVVRADIESIQKIRDLLHVTFLSFSHPNIFKMIDAPHIVDAVENILKVQEQGLLGLDFRLFGFLFKNETKKRSGFENSLKHNIQLWETNI